MACSKIKYKNKKSADKAIQKIFVIARLNNQKNLHKLPIRSYRCNECGKFHTTSMPIKKYKKIKKKNSNRCRRK